MAGFGTALAIGSAAFGAASSVAQARSQNEAIRRSAQSRRRSADIQSEQLENRARQQQQQLSDEADRIRGRIRVASAERGIGTGGTTEALARQTAINEAENIDTVQANLRRQQQRVQSGLRADLTQLEANLQSPLLGGLSGGLQGAQTGLAIGEGIQSFQEMQRREQELNRLDNARAPQQRPFS